MSKETMHRVNNFCINPFRNKIGLSVLVTVFLLSGCTHSNDSRTPFFHVLLLRGENVDKDEFSNMDFGFDRHVSADGETPKIHTIFRKDSSKISINEIPSFNVRDVKRLEIQYHFSLGPPFRISETINIQYEHPAREGKPTILCLDKENGKYVIRQVPLTTNLTGVAEQLEMTKMQRESPSQGAQQDMKDAAAKNDAETGEGK